MNDTPEGLMQELKDIQSEALADGQTGVARGAERIIKRIEAHIKTRDQKTKQQGRRE